ncbi:protein of unknown function (plasmid) [Pararobbsia alpina]|uniref:hypothetical protein n=1 Tax=Pararobbsia alpina TaxID=621374 RepID=UPI0039A56850
MVVDSFEHINAAPDDFVAGLLSPMSHLMGVFANRVTDILEQRRWWDRLWSIAEQHEEPVNEDDIDRLYDRVINRPSGRLVEWLLVSINARTADSKVLKTDRLRLRRVAASRTNAGLLGCGALTHNAGYTLAVDWRAGLCHLRARLDDHGFEGIALRAVLLGGAQLGYSATRAFKSQLIRSVCECRFDGQMNVVAASRLVHPLIHWEANASGSKPPVLASEVRNVFEKAPLSVLAGAAECFRKWIPHIGTSPAEAWETHLSRLFDEIWPSEIRFRHASVSEELVELCVSTGASFVQAFDQIRPYLVPLTNGVSAVYVLAQTQIPEKSPVQCLEMLWLVLGPGAIGKSTELPNVLDRIATSAPRLCVDRRLQWLEQHRAVRFE